MTQISADSPPATGALLVLIHGHPASGKSTLAASLGGRLRVPVLAKDDVLEALFDAGLPSTRDTRMAANRALLRLARRVLGAGHDCIVDSNLEAALWQAEVAQLLEHTNARLLQVRCSAEGDLLLQRFVARATRRHPGHRDEDRLQELRGRLLGAAPPPMALPGTVLDYDSGRGADEQAQRVFDAVDRALRRRAR